MCLAKLASKLTEKTSVAEFPRLLLTQGTSTARDEFVEVHIFGPLSMKTVSKAVLHSGRTRSANTLRKVVGQLLEKAGVTVVLKR